MLVSDVISKIRFFTSARAGIQNDRNLSPAGIERQAKNLEQSIQLFRGTAFDALQGAWKDARKRGGEIQEMRARAEQQESARWDYNKLNFETSSAERKLKSFSTLEEVTNWLKTATVSGNMELQRAVLETAPGFIRNRFRDVVGAGSLAVQLERQLGSLLSTPELRKVERQEHELAGSILQLVRDTEETGSFFEPSGRVWADNEFSTLLANVRLSTKVNPEDFERFTVTTVEWNPEPAPAGDTAGV